jgi:hypothetical protein
MYCHVKWLSTDVSEVCTASIIRDDHPSTSQMTILNNLILSADSMLYIQSTIFYQIYPNPVFPIPFRESMLYCDHPGFQFCSCSLPYYSIHSVQFLPSCSSSWAYCVHQIYHTFSIKSVSITLTHFLAIVHPSQSIISLLFVHLCYTPTCPSYSNFHCFLCPVSNSIYAINSL